MAEERAQRRLAAILAADVVGYCRLMEQDEAGTLALLKERRSRILVPLVAEHHGRIVKLMGDGVLVEFASAVNAVACAVKLQNCMTATNQSLPDHRRVVLRIGINLGDVVVEGGDLYGDGVNLAARLQELAEPGGICVSAKVREEVGRKVDIGFEDFGEQQLKNITMPVHVYVVRSGPFLSAATSEPPALPDARVCLSEVFTFWRNGFFVSKVERAGKPVVDPAVHCVERGVRAVHRDALFEQRE